MRAVPRFMLALFLAAFSGAAQAHELSVAHLRVEPTPGGATLIEVDLALRDLALALPLDADHDERVTWAELERLRLPLESRLERDLRLSDASGTCPLRLQRLGVRRYENGAYAALVLEADCRSGKDLRLDYSLFFDTDAQHRALVTVVAPGGSGTSLLRAGSRRLVLPEAGASPFLAFLREGVGHILSGYDHLAFLLLLLLPAPLVLVAGAWQPASDWRRVAWPAVGLVSAFTVAHSITLSCAALGWVRPGSYWVEAAIAASVVLAALNNLWPVVTRRLWLVGFGFGLVHGLGFAGALLETGLPTQSRLWALLGFNLGVELGQLGVVALSLPVLFLLRGTRAYTDVVLRLASTAIALLAGWWLWTRLSG